MILKLTDIYKMLANITERNNDKIKTFAALRFVEEFSDVAMNKGAYYQNGTNDGLFYSKAWKEAGYPVNKTPIDFPALIAFSNSSKIQPNFCPLYTVQIYTAAIEEKGVKAWELILDDLDNYIVTVLRDLQRYVYITASETEGWYYDDEVDTKEAAGVWTNVVRDGWMKERLKSRSISYTRGYEQTPKNLLTVGTEIEVAGFF